MKVLAFCDYDNYHAFSIIDEMNQIGNLNAQKFFFNSKPSWRIGNKWDNTSAKKFSFSSLKHIKSLFFAETIIMWGIFNPLIKMFFIFLFSVLLRKRIYICSEGFKKRDFSFKKHILKFIIRNLPQEKVSILCIGNGSNKDYQSIGFKNSKFHKFGFFEKYEKNNNLVNYKTNVRTIHDTVNILYVGQLIERKNVESLLLSLKDVKRPVVVDIAGNGDYLDDLISIASTLPYNCKVNFHGHCDEIQLHQLYSNSDVFFLGSKYEGWGVVVNQAISYGLPLILSSNVRSGNSFLLSKLNGIEFNNINEISQFINSLTHVELNSMAFESKRLGDLWDIESSARKFLKELNSNLDLQIEGPFSSYEP